MNVPLPNEAPTFLLFKSNHYFLDDVDFQYQMMPNTHYTVSTTASNAFGKLTCKTNEDSMVEV